MKNDNQAIWIKKGYEIFASSGQNGLSRVYHNPELLIKTLLKTPHGFAVSE
jgi:hypothetical protein